MSKDNLILGVLGEEAAADLLRKEGYRILHRNYRNRFGEIDIIASDKRTLCFVEVKARQGGKFGVPEEALSEFKIRQISKTALGFLKENRFLNRKARFDVVAVVYSEGSVKPRLIKSAFELNDRFSY